MKLLYSYLKIGALFFYLLSFAPSANTQVTVAREWNEILLEAIRNDFARPTVHARNLYHHSIIVYDAWAIYDPSRDTYLAGDTLHGYACEFEGVDIPLDIRSAREEAIAHASYYFIKARYQSSPDYYNTFILMYNFMTQHGYNINNTNTDYINGGPAELGNYLAQEILNYGYADGSNELLNYENMYYTPVNPPLVMSDPGNPDIIDPNRWQQLTLDSTIDQSGNLVQNTVPFISPEWGNVDPFSLDPSMYNEHTRDGGVYNVYFDTVEPAYLNITDSSDWDSFYKWNHSLVSIWQSHLDPSDGVSWDISPASIGNNTWYPSDSSEYPAFYNLLDGGDPSTGYLVNPVTGQPYTPQIVPRADYARVLAEFWADGIDSETPPGHWFEIYHYVTDQPTFERKWQGIGPELEELEFDVKTHLTLGGAMHDAAICAWSLKGYVDYIRPVSSIRYMVGNGQSSDSLLPSYHPNGIPLLPNYIELVDSLDPLAGSFYEHVGKIKLYTWRGHDFINDPLIDIAGVGWILGESWWPYQRPTFVTPPFSGFVSGHSTFSRAAAGILEYITGSPYFPGGLGEFSATQNEFLQFEDGPSVPITLQWASYLDAADQCSLSRIWGGIHPPIDDIPGRMIGGQVGVMCFNKADSIFSIAQPSFTSVSISDTVINSYDSGTTVDLDISFNIPMDISIIPDLNLSPANLYQVISVDQVIWVDSFNLKFQMGVNNNLLEQYTSLIRIVNLNTGQGIHMEALHLTDFLIVDTKLPQVISLVLDNDVINDDGIAPGTHADIQLNEECKVSLAPDFTFYGTNYLNPTFTFDAWNSDWISGTEFSAVFSIFDYNEEVDSVHLMIENIEDIHGNPLSNPNMLNIVSIDTKNPSLTAVVLSDTLLNLEDLANTPQFDASLEFDENMDISILPEIEFYNGLVLHSTLLMNSFQSFWLDSTTLSIETWMLNDTNNLIELDLVCISAIDKNGNEITDTVYSSVLYSDLHKPMVQTTEPVNQMISDSLVGILNYFVDITFDEQMDTGTKPLLVHNANQSLTGSLQYDISESEYLDPFIYRAYFQVIDENIEEDSIDIIIVQGKDFAGNSQEQYEESAFVSLDTKNPSVSNLTVNSSVINPGEQLEISVTFDEDMFTNQLIQFDFTPQISSPVILNQTGYSWQNDSNLLVHYDLLSGDITSQDYDLSILNGVDKAGNLLIAHTESSLFTIPGSTNTLELKDNGIQIYPNLISNGQKISIVGNGSPLIPDEVKLFNAEGKSLDKLRFVTNGAIWVSEPIHVEPGVYYIIVNETSFKLIVI